MFSSKIAMCSSPRPETLKASGDTKSTLSPTFTSSSRSRYSRSWRLVTYFPSLPANGELLTRKLTVIVGSSIEIAEKGSVEASTVMVSPIKMSGRPAIIQMSPAEASGASTRSIPLKVKILVIFPVRDVPSGFLTVTFSGFIVPS